MKEDLHLLPSELKHTRTRLGFTQQKLARELGVSRVSVVRWETGLYKIPLTVMLALKYLEHKLFQGREHTSITPSANTDRS
jgi:DNA-binding XRE family transcriptional regulator